ncbi:MAG: trehalose-phosphatase, partial [Nitriliruptorales bacterium]|nr:trehalose-phosphatase [Nitriliruptorales bacterium]
YREHVDGRPRYDGVRTFLDSRGITLPEGDPEDPPDAETVCGLGNRKNSYFRRSLTEDGVQAYPTSVELIHALRTRGIATAIVSSSQNAGPVLDAAGLSGLFEVRVDGLDAAEQHLPGKPDPALFLEAARRLDVEASRSVVVEDALSGVEAGRRGGFGLVVGVDRVGQADALRASGADVVVTDLGELRLEGETMALRPAAALPSALHQRAIEERLSGRTPAVFLDYDGTLSAIVSDPGKAIIEAEMREAVRRLAQRCTVAIVSGRDLPDVRRFVGLDGLVYAGSHGFDIQGPQRLEVDHGAEAYLEPLREAERELERRLAGVKGAGVERKRYAVAMHFRNVPDDEVDRFAQIVDEVARAYPRLRKTGGKKVFELRPDLDWDKGRAVLWLLRTLGLDRDGIVPIYVGDDVTDEDAFVALAEGDVGVGIVVGDVERTAAQYRLGDVDEVRAFLEDLTGLLDRRAG